MRSAHDVRHAKRDEPKGWSYRSSLLQQRARAPRLLVQVLVCKGKPVEDPHEQLAEGRGGDGGARAGAVQDQREAATEG